MLFSSERHTVQRVSTKAEVVLEQVRGLPPADLRELCRRVNQLVAESAEPTLQTRHGIPLARNDGVPMTAEEVAATLNDG
ncbi:MAG: hypothetical protein FJ387_11965 [Verrucomicrobia bacterium]|nr:hypothetical protein [Verrucomicrobiota bacterium]